MPDNRKHRGPHPKDIQRFSTENVLRLRLATHDLSWLLSRGYVNPSALKLVGDRYRITKRQQTSVFRSACSDQKLERRSKHRLSSNSLSGRPLWIDGYNVLTSIEAALSGGVLLRGRDGCLRDMASMHGSYRKVMETIPAIELIGQALEALNVSEVKWLLDQPVSNSGRLRSILLEMAEKNHWNWMVDLVPDPDKLLKQASTVVSTADSVILDHAQEWFALVDHVVAHQIANAWIVDLSVMEACDLPADE